MRGLEGDPQARRPLFRRFGERIGLFRTPQQQAEINRRFQESLTALNQQSEREAKEREALVHSDACFSEIEYVLGITNVDPHPGHAIQYHPDYPLPPLPQDTVSS